MFPPQMWALSFVLQAAETITVAAQNWACHSWACGRLVVFISPERWLECLGTCL